MLSTPQSVFSPHFLAQCCLPCICRSSFCGSSVRHLHQGWVGVEWGAWWIWVRGVGQVGHVVGSLFACFGLWGCAVWVSVCFCALGWAGSGHIRLCMHGGAWGCDRCTGFLGSWRVLQIKFSQFSYMFIIIRSSSTSNSSIFYYLFFFIGWALKTHKINWTCLSTDKWPARHVLRFFISREKAIMCSTPTIQQWHIWPRVYSWMPRETEISWPWADNNHASQPLLRRQYESQKWQRGCLFIAQ